MAEREHWTTAEEILRDEVSKAYKAKDCIQKTYHWILTTVVGILCVLAGITLQSERYSKTIYTTEYRVGNLEKQFDKIDGKLNLLLEKAETGEK